MKMKLSAIFMAALLIAPSVYGMDRDRQNNPRRAAQEEANEEKQSWVPKIIKDNKAVQAALVIAALGGAAYTFTEPVLSFGSTYARRILLNSQTARWITLATWNILYDNCPSCADWIYFQALI